MMPDENIQKSKHASPCLIVACCTIGSAEEVCAAGDRHDAALFWTATGLSAEATECAIAMLRGRCSWCAGRMAAWEEDDADGHIGAAVDRNREQRRAEGEDDDG